MVNITSQEINFLIDKGSDNAGFTMLVVEVPLVPHQAILVPEGLKFAKGMELGVQIGA